MTSPARADQSGSEDARDRPLRARSGGVQSIERAFALLEIMAERGGVMGLSQLAATSGLPLPTIHRLARTLVDLGYVRQDLSRQYVLAPRLIRLGESSSRLLTRWARPDLEALVQELGESANLAMLDGDMIVYVAQAQSNYAMRMFTEVGRRVLPHCTAVGKALLAQLPPEEVHSILRRTGMPKHTPNTIDDPRRFARELEAIALQGYAIDEGEEEVGVRCVAVAVPDAPSRLGLSVSGPAARMTSELVETAVPLLMKTAESLSAKLQ